MRQPGSDRSLHRIVTVAVHCSHLEAYIHRSKNLLFIYFLCLRRPGPELFRELVHELGEGVAELGMGSILPVRECACSLLFS